MRRERQSGYKDKRMAFSLSGLFVNQLHHWLFPPKPRKPRQPRKVRTR